MNGRTEEERKGKWRWPGTKWVELGEEKKGRGRNKKRMEEWNSK